MYKSRAMAWIRALKSGKYPQATGSLCRLSYDDDGNSRVAGWCCLGVLCDLAIKDGVKMSVSESGGQRCYDSENGTLPRAVQVWAGLDATNPLLSDSAQGPCEACGNDHMIEKPGLTATAANDTKKLTFAEIADLVKKRFLA